jgi:hypothetical protein
MISFERQKRIEDKWLEKADYDITDQKKQGEEITFSSDL